MYEFVRVVWSILAVSIIFLVFLHSPKGDGLASIGGQAQMFSGTKTAEANLNRFTWAIVVLFVATTFVLSRGPASTPRPAAVPPSPPAIPSQL
ncbi:MAG TPA: preprotein translocase subunit SecG [Cyanobacteria bacterium UBA8156]|jgi:preprotein translocase subunit SecG|nr:preprotein translocase subunit SecG [Cyanobacteria bacterium UBA8156]